MASVDIGDNYPTQIPSLQDNANIQTALILYHYGQEIDPASYEDILPNSVAGHFKALQESKLDLEATRIVAGADNDFDLKIETGFYSVGTSVLASATNAIPTVGGNKYPGMLTVVYEPSEGVVYQTYHMTDGTTSGINEKAWRAKFNGAWTSWKFDNSHNHDASAITSGFFGISRGGTNATTPLGARTNLGAQASNVITANAVMVTDSSGNIAPSSSITVSELGQLDGAANQVQTTILGNKAVSTPVPAGIKRMVIARDNGSGVPDATITPVEGDLWFW